MEKVKFILPSNEIIELNMWEVSNFCKSICLKAENVVDFLEFEKDYTKFDAYFDFVVFHLNYLYSIGNRYFIPSEKEINNLYGVDESELDSISYQSVLHASIDYFRAPFLTKCSDSELQIAKLDSSEPRPAFMDEDLICYFNSTGGGVSSNNWANHMESVFD